MARTHKSVISEAMRLLGSRTSDKKAKSSAANGKKGGRPKHLCDWPDGGWCARCAKKRTADERADLGADFIALWTSFQGRD